MNLEIAAVFTEIADLLEFKDENPFKIRAYRKAAAVLQDLPTDISTLVRTGGLRGIEGIGEALAAKITEYVNSGRVGFLEDLRQEVPPSLRELTQVSGVGPKLAMRLYKELGIQGLSDLEEAVVDQRLRHLKGLGAKSEANIALGLRELAQYQGRRPLYEALPLARELAEDLRTLPGVHEAAVAGSLRRMCDMIGDIDIVVGTVETEVVSHYLTHLTLVQRVLAHGKTKLSLLLHGGMQVDIRLVNPDAFASALHHSTGSKEHHVGLRPLALRQGFSISEYGLLDTETGKRIVPKSEEELYGLLGLPFIPPELREGTGEIEAALAGCLPQLITRQDMRGDLHVHSNWSDGTATLEELARAGAEYDLQYIAVCDHSKSLSIAGGLTAEELDQRNKEITKVNDRKNGAVLLRGIEVDILADGSLDFPDEVLQRCEVVVASIHSGLRQERAQLMRRLRRAMENPYVHIIGHPTGRLLGRRAASDVDVDELVRIARRTGTVLEINSSPDRLDLSDGQARQAAKAGVMLAVDSDGHDPSEFGLLDYGISVARRAWLEQNMVINCRPLPDLLELLSLKRKEQRG